MQIQNKMDMKTEVWAWETPKADSDRTSFSSPDLRGQKKAPFAAKNKINRQTKNKETNKT